MTAPMVIRGIFKGIAVRDYSVVLNRNIWENNLPFTSYRKKACHNYFCWSI